MNRFFTSSLVAALGIAAVGCGGGGDGAASGEAPATEQPAATEAPAASLSVPDWMSVDEAGMTVTLEIVAGKDDSNNRWNFNGYSRGNGTIVVPAGYNVVINFRNDDRCGFRDRELSRHVPESGAGVRGCDQLQRDVDAGGHPAGRVRVDQLHG
jgi:hypothetical protein